MTFLEWSLMAASAVFALAGLCLLFLCWEWPGRPAVLVAAWALLIAAAIAAFISNGDRGVAQGVVIAMALVVGWFAVPLARGIAPPQARKRLRQGPAVQPVSRPWKACLTGVWTFVLCGPLAGAIALLASAGLFKLIRPAEGSPATAGVVALIAAVLIWAVSSVLLLIEPRSGRRSLYAGGLLVASAAAAFI